MPDLQLHLTISTDYRGEFFITISLVGRQVERSYGLEQESMSLIGNTMLG